MDRADIHDGYAGCVSQMFPAVRSGRSCANWRRRSCLDLGREAGQANARSAGHATAMRDWRVGGSPAGPVAVACAGGRDRADAGSVSRPLPRLHGEALRRTSGQAAPLHGGGRVPGGGVRAVGKWPTTARLLAVAAAGCGEKVGGIPRTNLAG